MSPASVMILKKPSLLASAYSNLHPLTSVPGSSTSSNWLPASTRQRQDGGITQRGYATIAGDPEEHQSNPEQHERDHEWPSPPKGQPCPTPYQIFAMKHTAQYSKARFYDLVKIYHPDLSNGSSGHMSQQIKMERYRLLVAAHTILSDPVKRNAYDRFGAGWNGRAEVGPSESWHQPSPFHPPGPFSQSWTNPGDPIWRNATWEDWERFHAQRARENGDTDAARRVYQAPVYMRNSYFVALLVLLAMMGGSANYNRAQDAGTYFVEQRDLVHDRAAKELRKVRQEMAGMKGRDERIQFFLRQREATMGQMAGTDSEALREERANRLLPDREVCRSEGVSEEGT